MNGRLSLVFGMFMSLALFVKAQSWYDEPIPLHAADSEIQAMDENAHPQNSSPEDSRLRKPAVDRVMNMQPFLSPTTVFQESIIKPHVLTIQEACRLAAEHSSAVKSLQAELSVTRAGNGFSSYWKDPQLRTGYDYTRLRDDSSKENKDSGEVALRIHLPHSWAEKKEMEAVESMGKAEEFDAKALEWNIAYEVKKCFLNISYLDRKLDMDRSLVQIRSQRKVRADEMMTMREMTVDESLGCRLSHLRSISTRNKTKRELIGQIGLLIAMTGISESDGWKIEAPTLRAIIDLQDINKSQLLHSALEYRAEIEAEKQRLKAAQQKLEAQRKRRMPWLDYIQVGYEQNGLESADDETWSIKAGIDLPIITALQSTDRGAAAAEVNRAMINLTNAQSDISDEINEAIYLLKECINNRRKVYDEVQPLLAEIKDTVLASNEELGNGNGLSDIIEDRKIEAEITLLDAEYELRMAMLQVEYASGTDL